MLLKSAESQRRRSFLLLTMEGKVDWTVFFIIKSRKAHFLISGNTISFEIGKQPNNPTRTKTTANNKKFLITHEFHTS